MQSRDLAGVSVSFDGPDLVPCAGPLPVAVLAPRLDVAGVIDAWLTLARTAIGDVVSLRAGALGGYSCVVCQAGRAWIRRDERRSSSPKGAGGERCRKSARLTAWADQPRVPELMRSRDGKFLQSTCTCGRCLPGRRGRRRPIR